MMRLTHLSKSAAVAAALLSLSACSAAQSGSTDIEPALMQAIETHAFGFEDSPLLLLRAREIQLSEKDAEKRAMQMKVYIASMQRALSILSEHGERVTSQALVGAVADALTAGLPEAGLTHILNNVSGPARVIALDRISALTNSAGSSDVALLIVGTEMGFTLPNQPEAPNHETPPETNP